MIERVRGNLLEAKVEALVNTVNTVGVMGKGIALQFKRAFPENFRAYKRECAAERLTIGRVFTSELPRDATPRYIINFPTKKHWRSESRIEFIDAGLDALVNEVRRLQVKSLAVPPIGCGHGGLSWAEVYPRIERAFAAVPDVRVLVFEPGGAPAAQDMPNATTRPAMTPGRAAVLALMQRYIVPGYDYRLSLLEVQKLAYFLQAAGQPLKLAFQEHHYGPYADTLRHVLNRLEGHYVRGLGDGQNKPDTPIEILPGTAAEAEAFLAEDESTQTRFERVARLIEGFETPFGMELLATVHWVAAQHEDARSSASEAHRYVHDWSRRKAALMKPGHVAAAWHRLQAHAWI